jgi:hypothetical protein
LLALPDPMTFLFFNYWKTSNLEVRDFFDVNIGTIFKKDGEPTLVRHRDTEVQQLAHP